jgi:hypothetical protein
MDEEPSVSYSVKDLLSEITKKLDAALLALYAKADNARVDALETEVRAIRNHIDKTKENTSLRSQYRQWLIPTLIAVAMLITTVIPLIK